MLWSWDEGLPGTSLLRAINWHEGHLHSPGGTLPTVIFWWESHQRSDLAGSNSTQGWLANLTVCAELQHMAPAISAVPTASSQGTPTLLLHPLSVWVASYSHLISLKTLWCSNLWSISCVRSCFKRKLCHYHLLQPWAAKSVSVGTCSFVHNNLPGKL